MADQPETVTVEALQLHTYNGNTYQVGDVYEIPVSLLDSVIVQGKAKAAAKVDKPAARTLRATGVKEG